MGGMERGGWYSIRRSKTSPSIFDRSVLGSPPGSSEESWIPLLDSAYTGSKQPSQAAVITAFLAS